MDYRKPSFPDVQFKGNNGSLLSCFIKGNTVLEEYLAQVLCSVS